MTTALTAIAIYIVLPALGLLAAVAVTDLIIGIVRRGWR
jgi:hypothetical protein